MKFPRATVLVTVVSCGIASLCALVPAGLASAEVATARVPNRPVDRALTAPTSTILTVSPSIGTPEWDRMEAEDKKWDEHLKRVMKSICRGC